MLLSSVQGLGSYNAHPHLCTPVAVTLGSAVRTGTLIIVFVLWDIYQVRVLFMKYQNRDIIQSLVYWL